MRLSRPFLRLPVQFDVARLQSEVTALPAQAWSDHPNQIAGNSALRLVSVDGGENDDVDGKMAPTPHLIQSPYLRQVLASFGVVWSRSRLMKLAPGAQVPEHADINYHWYYRVRLHIPVFTHPSVEFHCGDEVVHMTAGSAWIFDNWRRHSVLNPSDRDRIHLVADTSGSAQFWQFAAQDHSNATLAQHRYDPDRNDAPMVERNQLAPVMSPAEVDLLVMDMRSELVALQGAQAQERVASGAHGADRLNQYHVLLEAFRRDWRQLYSLYGEGPAGWQHYATLRKQLRTKSRELGDDLAMRTNGIGAHKVLEGRLLSAILPAIADGERRRPARAPRAPDRRIRLHRPVFIIAAPRSGSTLLFETLGASDQLCTLGGEAHWLAEGLEYLRPGAPGVNSNRLTDAQVTEEVTAHVYRTIAAGLLDNRGSPVQVGAHTRLLEKTPKNSLRIPFLNAIFPDALFIFLWRDPRENLSSIIEAWRSGHWRTYSRLEGFEGPWSLVLPPGFSRMNGRPVQEIAAFQWTRVNETVLGDLATLPRERWTPVQYGDFLARPEEQTRRLCRFMGIEMDESLHQRVTNPLPLSRFTQTLPDVNKWQRNAAVIERVMPLVEPLWRRLLNLQTDSRSER